MVGRNGSVLLLQFAKDLIQADAGLLDIGVQVAGAAALAAGRLLGLAPQGRVDALADVVLDARPLMVMRIQTEASPFSATWSS